MRLDQYLVKHGLVKSRDRAQAMIKNPGVRVAEKLVRKPAFKVSDQEKVELLQADIKFVSRGGLKLEHALQEFGINAEGLTCLDVGVATGGFTDCLLQAGAKKVIAIDVGKGQLASELVSDSRVEFYPDTDARDLSVIKAKPDLIVIDVSFISITALLPSLKKFVSDDIKIIVLIKPQFELGQKHKGVIRDSELLEEVQQKLRDKFEQTGFDLIQETKSPILGKTGNQEYLWLLQARQ